MIVPIYIDVRDLAAEFQLTKDQITQLVDDAVKAAALEFYRLWSVTAGESLRSTRSRYLDSLILVDEGLMKGAVVLRYDDPLVRMLEEGASPFDMKEGFAKSNKRKFTKSGSWYLTIPYRYAASTSLGESEVFAGVLPTPIHNLLKKESLDIPYQSGFRTAGLSEDQLPQEFRAPTVRAAIPATPTSKAYTEYVAKNSPYVGMIKIADGTTGQNRFMSFRRVSANSDPDAWIHKGFTASNFAQKALDALDIETIIDISVDNYLASL